MRHTLLLLLVPTLAVAAVAAACTSSDSAEAEAITEDDAGEPTTLPPAPEPKTTDAAAPIGGGTGLPCDVQGILENRCLACHSGVNPPRLETFDDLATKSQKDPSKTYALVALELMKANAMPPTPAVPPELDEVASFEDWLKAGMPRNPVACTDEPPDGGVSDAGILDGGDGGTTCTSGKLWTQGNKGSALMHPGAACNACHQQQGGPNLRMAGTVYPTLHEPIDCNGSAPPPQLTVVITDARNKVFNIPVNAAGNFETNQRPRLPIKAKITDGTKTRSMLGPVTSGDCNGCHTETGAKGAPGRIMAP